MAYSGRRGRVWLAFYDEGFVVTDRLGERDYRDEEVHAIAYSVESTFANGVASGFTRKCTLWVAHDDEDPEPIAIENGYKLKQRDPVEGLLNRLLDQMQADFDEALSGGAALEGEGWRLSRHELAVRQGKIDESLPTRDIAAVETHEGKVSVWVKGNDEALVGFPVTGRNVWLLLRLLNARIVNDARAKQPPAEGLGRILFQRRSSTAAVVGLFILAAGLAIIGAAVFTGVKSSERYWGIALLLGSPLAGLGAVACLKGNFRCHEWGVYQTGLTGEKTLMYNDVASFTYLAIRNYHNGAYVGTTIRLTFLPLPEANSRTISYSASVKNQDADLEMLRDFVSRVISSRMARELNAGKTVPWTKNIAFRPDGFEYTLAGFFRKQETQFLPYDDYGGWKMDQGKFMLYRRNVSKPLVTEAVSEANFFPGFMLLQAMFHAPQPTDPKQPK